MISFKIYHWLPRVSSVATIIQPELEASSNGSAIPLALTTTIDLGPVIIRQVLQLLLTLGWPMYFATATCKKHFWAAHSDLGPTVSGKCFSLWSLLPPWWPWRHWAASWRWPSSWGSTSRWRTRRSSWWPSVRMPSSSPRFRWGQKGWGGAGAVLGSWFHWQTDSIKDIWLKISPCFKRVIMGFSRFCTMCLRWLFTLSLSLSLEVNKSLLCDWFLLLLVHLGEVLGTVS